MDENISCQSDRLTTLEAANNNNLNELQRLSNDIRMMINEFESKLELKTDNNTTDHGNKHQIIENQNPTFNDELNNNCEANDEVFEKFLDSCNERDVNSMSISNFNNIMIEEIKNFDNDEHKKLHYIEDKNLYCEVTAKKITKIDKNEKNI